MQRVCSQLQQLQPLAVYYLNLKLLSVSVLQCPDGSCVQQLQPLA
jgi:hypothetical protein